ncbi:ATP-binding protein [Sphingomonas horti]|nr:ATP-binding protein [Sphingomonas horti]
MSLAELASESTVLFDEDGRVRYWNPAAERLFGWPALSVEGVQVTRLAASSRQEASAWAALLQEGFWRGVLKRRSRDGHVVEVQARRLVRFEDSGELRDVVEFAAPTSGHRPTSIDPIDAPDQMMAASWEIDVAPCESILADIEGERAGDPDGRHAALYQEIVEKALIVRVNKRTARLVGGNRTREIMAGQRVAAFWPLASRSALGELIVEALRSEAGRSVFRGLPTDGILRDPVVTAWRADSERPTHVFISVEGVADDDRSYLYLKASEARYRKLIHYMPVALLQVDASHMGKIYAGLRAQGVVDFDGYLQEHPELIDLAGRSVPVTDVNRRAVELLGGQGPHDLIRPVGHLFAISPATLRRVMVGRFSGRTSHSEFMKVRALDGRVLDVRFSVTYPEPLTELDTTIFSLEDMTDRVRMEAQLRQLQADYSHAARVSMLGELTSSIAHEVNQPLAAIMTNAETSLRWLARDVPDVTKVTQLTARIAASARRADEIVQRIRGMASKRAPETVSLTLNEIVQQSLLFVKHEIETRSIRVATSCARNLPRVMGDRVQLQQVVVNLLINAAQAMEGVDEAERLLTIETMADAEGSSVLTLRDRGPGIPAEHLSRIFDGFFTTKDEGMGIGLAICRSIVAAHGGTISAANVSAGGAEFRVELPAAEVAPRWT